MTLSAIAFTALLALLLVAAFFDLRSRRIPNWLTLVGFAIGLACGTLLGWSGLGDALLGGLTGFALFFFLYALGAMGAGDVKLMAAAGSLLGFPLVLWGALCSAIAGGVLAAAVVLRRRAFARVAGNIGRLLSFWVWSRGIRRAEWLTLESPGALSVPYGVAICLGCAFAALFPGLSVF